MAGPLRVLLVDDHTLFLKGVASLLAERLDVIVVGKAKDGPEAIVRARETAPDVVLMDICMPGGSGLEAVRTIKQEMPQVCIIMLTASDRDSDLFAAIKAGADGYLLKDLEPRQLYDMLVAARHGEAAISSTVAARILQELRRPAREPDTVSDQVEKLTAREVDVLRLLAEGASNKEIAATLSISENTVKSYMANVLDKLHLRNRVQAAVYAVREGLADDKAVSEPPANQPSD